MEVWGDFVGIVETPVPRRRIRPLQQSIDLRFVRTASRETPFETTQIYTRAGRPAGAVKPPGSLLDTRA